MNNFFKIYINELTKVLKKKSTKVFLILLLLTLLVCAGFTYLTKLSNDNIGEISNTYSLTYAKQRFESLDENSGTYNEEYVSAKTEYEVLEFFQTNGIINKVYNTNIWYSYAYDNMYSLTLQILSQEFNVGEKLSDVEFEKIKGKYEELKKIIEEKDFLSYVEYERKNIEENYSIGNITEEEREEKLYENSLISKYEIKTDNEDNYWKSQVLQEIIMAKKMLNTGINSVTNKSLTLEDEEKYKDIITLNEYRLKENIQISGNTNNLRQLYISITEEMSMGILGLFVIIVAGGILSREFSKGTIKLLMINPAKRWKILLSKLLTVITILVVLTVILSLTTSLIGKTVFGTYNIYEYVEINNGVINTINPVIYSVLRFLVYAIDIFLYALLAMMISTLFRSTSAAVGTSMLFYMGNSIMMLILNNLIKKEWIKFIPFNNMNLINKIFTSDLGIIVEINSIALSNQIVSNISLTFSISLLGVCAFLMIVTMFDSFNKKDII